MSFQAMTWAIEQKTGSPRAKCVLLSLANYANAQWCAYPKQDLIAEESEQSTDSVQKYLNDLVGPGLVRRIKLKRFGRRTHDFLILRPSPLFDAPLEDIRPHFPSGCDALEDAAATDGSDKNDSPSQSSQDSDIHAAATDGSVLNATLPPPAVDAADLQRQQEPVIEPKIPSQTLPPQNGEAKEQPKQEATANSAVEQFIERFRAIYPLPCSKPEEFAEDVAGLSEAERAQCLHGASGVAEYRRKNPKIKGIVGPNRFIKSSALWAEFSRFAAAEKAPPPPRVFVQKDSIEWRARLVLATITGSPMPEAKPDFDHQAVGADFLGHLPASGLALAQFTNVLGAVTLSEWTLLDKETRKGQIAAWRDRVHECTGKHIELQLIDMGGTTTSIINGRTYELPRRMHGLRVPSQWPPKKGSQSSSDSLATEEELHEFANTS